MEFEIKKTIKDTHHMSISQNEEGTHIEIDQIKVMNLSPDGHLRIFTRTLKEKFNIEVGHLDV